MDTPPNNVTVDPSGITVRRGSSREENGMRMWGLLFSAMGFTGILVMAAIWSDMPPTTLKAVAQGSLCLLFASLAPAILAFDLWRTLHQPTLRLTAHEIVIVPRWVPWGEILRFPLEDVELRGTIESWGDEMLWATIHLADHDKSTRWMLHNAGGLDQSRGEANLAWVMETLETARRRRLEEGTGSREDLEEALEALRDRSKGTRWTPE